MSADTSTRIRLALQPIYLRARDAAVMLAVSESEFSWARESWSLAATDQDFRPTMTRWRFIDIEEAAAKQDEASGVNFFDAKLATEAAN